MLALGRRPGQSIVINPDHPTDQVLVTAVRFNGGTIILGFEARRDLQIVRFEVMKRAARGEPWRGGAIAQPIHSARDC